MGRHLTSCAARRAAIDEANQSPGAPEQLYHVQVQDAWGGDYWLHLEMKGSAELDDLDYYLRAIWLECCGHMSHFSTGGWGGRKVGKSRLAREALQVGQELTHLYDYGTTSETLIRVKSVRVGQPLTRHAIVLLARNAPLQMDCMECESPATWLCMECVIEEEKVGLLCDQHAESHPHDDYGAPVPVVNSPRLGLCGYCGPAEPPY
jgi:hypothetical protein